jgi:integrating conjugative element protein (TIGR03758 family)
MPTVIDAFHAASGSMPENISLFVRTVLCVLFFIWAAWVIHGQFKLFQAGELSIHDMPMTFVRALFLCSIMVILVFVK